MKTIGLLGGMSWESTLEYYRAINQGINAALGDLHSGKVVMYSVDSILSNACNMPATGQAPLTSCVTPPSGSSVPVPIFY